MNRPALILKTLVDHYVEFVGVGWLAALACGAAIRIWDFAIVYAATPPNIQRLLAALTDLDAHYRQHRDLKPSESRLAGPDDQLLITRLGPLDVLGSVGKGRSYADLLPHTVEIELVPGLRCRVLDLETQIAIKEEIGAEKDLAMLPILRRTLAESRRLQ